MKKQLFFTLLLAFMLPLSSLADDGKVCPVEGGSVQAEVTNSPVAKNVGAWFEYEISFIIMNSSPNFVNATYVIRDNNGEERLKARVLIAPQKETEKKAVVRTKSSKSTFVVDIVEGDCKKE